MKLLTAILSTVVISTLTFIIADKVGHDQVFIGWVGGTICTGITWYATIITKYK